MLSVVVQLLYMLAYTELNFPSNFFGINAITVALISVLLHIIIIALVVVAIVAIVVKSLLGLCQIHYL